MAHMAATNGAVLTAHEATIQTAQVEIQILKVGKKQVTMGMFRQLPFKALTRFPTEQFLGEPWGYVEYWWAGDGRQQYESGGYVPGTHLHLVWQDQGRLYRDIVYQDPMRQYLWNYEQRVQKAAETYWLETHPGIFMDAAWERPRPWQTDATVHTFHQHVVAQGLATPQVAALFDDWYQAVDERQTYVDAWAKQWESLTRLPQLFIAV